MQEPRKADDGEDSVDGPDDRRKESATVAPTVVPSNRSSLEDSDNGTKAFDETTAVIEQHDGGASIYLLEVSADSGACVTDGGRDDVDVPLGRQHVSSSQSDVKHAKPSKIIKQTSVVSHSYTNRDMLLTIYSIISYLFDVGSDIFVAWTYYHGDDWWWFGLTVAFIVVPSVTMTFFSLAWYLQDKDNSRNMLHPLQWASRAVFLFLQLGPILRSALQYILLAGLLVGLAYMVSA